MESYTSEIARNVDYIRQKIINACIRAGRNPESVKMVAVSKTVKPEKIKEAYDAGLRDFGENYVQEMLIKCESLPADIRWHFIGHLQTNKIKYLVNKVYMIHSVYKEEHLFEIEKRFGRENISTDLLIEVNIGNEITKSGIDAKDVIQLYKKSFDFKHLKIKGLMCIPPVSKAEESRGYFKDLRFLKDCINNELGREVVTELSMGMSSDFEVAIEEGATMVRIGTAIFGKRQTGGKNEDKSY